MKLVTISAKDVDNYINKSKYLIVDLREKKDYEKSHINGAKWMDYDDIDNNKVQLPRNVTIILYCERGGLSLLAAKKLSQMEYDVKSVIGGFNAYKGRNRT